MTKHAYLPTLLIADKGTAFMSHVIKEVARVLGITVKHAPLQSTLKQLSYLSDLTPQSNKHWR